VKVDTPAPQLASIKVAVYVLVTVGQGAAVKPVAVKPLGPFQFTVKVGAPVGINLHDSFVAVQGVKTFLPGGATAIVVL